MYSSSPFINGVRCGRPISTAGTLIVLELLVPVVLPSASLLVVSVILTWFLSLILSSGIPGGEMGRQTLFESNFSLGLGIVAVLRWASSWAWRSHPRAFQDSIFSSALLSASRSSESKGSPDPRSQNVRFQRDFSSPRKNNLPRKKIFFIWTLNTFKRISFSLFD